MMYEMDRKFLIDALNAGVDGAEDVINREISLIEDDVDPFIRTPHGIFRKSAINAVNFDDGGSAVIWLGSTQIKLECPYETQIVAEAFGLDLPECEDDDDDLPPTGPRLVA